MVGVISNSDILEIQKLNKVLGYNVAPKHLKSKISRIRKDKNSYFNVIRLNNHIVGYVHAEIRDFLHDYPKIEIVAIVIDPVVQGLGFGGMLVDSVCEWARKKKMKKVFLISNIKRLKAHAFYLSNRFKSMKTGHIFERNS